MTVPGHDPQDTWANIFNARDGAWGIAGRAYPNEDLLAGVTAAGTRV